MRDRRNLLLRKLLRRLETWTRKAEKIALKQAPSGSGYKSEAQRSASAEPTFSMNGIKPRRNEKKDRDKCEGKAEQLFKVEGM